MESSVHDDLQVKDTQSETNTSATPTSRRRILKRYKYAGDFNSPDMNSPRKAFKFYKAAKFKLLQNRRVISNERKKKRRLFGKVKSLEGVLTHLQDKNLISDNAYTHMMVRVTDILSYLTECDI